MLLAFASELASKQFIWQKVIKINSYGIYRPAINQSQHFDQHLLLFYFKTNGFLSFQKVQECCSLI